MERAWTWITVAALVVLTLAAYLPVRNADWVQDDHVAVESNPIVRRGDPIEIFSTDYWAGASGEDATLYRPVTVATWALERAVTGTPSSALAHGVNVVLHLAASVLLLVLARRLGAGPIGSSAAALLFGVHPVHVEAVAGIVGRAEILATIGVLGAMLCWSRVGPWPGRPDPTPAARRLAAAGAAACVFVALGSKEVAVAVLPLLAALDGSYRARSGLRRSARDLVSAWVPVGLAVTAWYLLRVHALGAWWAVQSPHPVDNPLLRLEGGERVATALGLLVRYLGLLVFPVRQSADWSGPSIPPEPGLLAPLPVAALALLAAAAVVAVAPFLPGREPGPRGRAASAGVLLFLLPYLVVGNLVVLVGTIFAERLMYLPSAGFCLLAGLFLSGLAGDYPAFGSWSPAARMRYVGVVLALLLAAFTVSTHARATVWQDDRSVFAAAVEVNPSSPRAHFILGKLDAEDGDLESALERFERSVALEPDYLPGWQEAGTTLARLGRYEEAIERFRTALAIRPDLPLSQYNLGLALQRLGRYEEAERAVRRAVRLAPDHAAAWATLGHLAMQTGRPEDAVAAYRRAVALGRDDLTDRLRELESSGIGR